MAKKLFAILVSLAMVFSLLPTFVVAEGTHTHDGQEYTAHTGTTALPTASGFYYLTADVTLPSNFNQYGQSYSGKITTICLNGYTISRTGSGRIFNVTGTSDLTICDCTGHGKITGGNMSGNGGAFNVASGGKLAVSDVEISGNTGVAAGAIAVQGTMTLDNVVLKNNTNTSAGGSAVYTATGGSVTMTDCTVTGNNSAPSSTSYNGAVYVTNQNASLTVWGKTVITGNTIGNGTASCDVLLQDAGTKLTVGALTADSEINITTEVKKFGTASAAADFLALASGTDTAALESAWTSPLITYVNTDQKVAYTAESGFFFGQINVPEEGHANTEGYDKCGHGTIAWTGVSTMAEINSAPSGHYYLKNDIDMSGVRLTVKSDVTICLNGYSMLRGATAGGYARAVHINAGAKLTICDCTAHEADGVYTAGKITGGWAAQGSGAYVAGELNLYDGIFTGNKTEDYNSIRGQGTIAVLKGGAFHMYGGEISGNTSTGDGAGVQMLSTEAEFVMTGGAIRNNAADGLGGGVYLMGTGAVIGSDAVITGNTAAGAASNVYLPAGVTFKAQSLTDKASIGFLMAAEPGTVVSTGAKQADLESFANDNTDSPYGLLLSGSRLVLGTPRTGDSHPVPGYDKCGHGDATITWLNWGDEDSELGKLPTASGYYYLSGDVALSATTAVTGDATVVLCLNGYNITGGSTLLQVDEGASYTVCDCVESGQLTGSPAVMVNGGSFALADGYITGCTVTGNATNTGAVHVAAGTFTMEGGYILDNPIHGVYVGGGTFNLKGGEISGNYSDTNGGGIRLRGGEFNMTGGEITGNRTGSSAGGSALAIQSGTATITGGEIYGNEAGSGGTIYSAGTLSISGVTIENNTAVSNGGGLYIQSGTTTLTDVILKNNQSTGSMGGGLFVGGGTVTVNGGEVIGNSALYGGGIRINGGTVILNGTAVTGNTASVRGGGVQSANAAAKLILGGSTVISGNTAAGAKSNLQLEGEFSAALDSVNYPLTEGAEIGISADLNTIIETGVLAATGADQSGAAAFFVSDQGQTVTAEGTELWLKLSAGATHAPHDPDECGHEEARWKPWLGGSMTSGHFYLIQDVELPQTVNVTEGDITVCLNGFDIIRTASASPDFDRIFRVSGGTLTICDCKGTGHITGGTACQGSAIFINGAEAEVNFYGGIISGNTSKDSASDPNTNSLGTVCVINGTFNMYGGEISDNTSVRGGAVSVFKEGAVFNLHDGKLRSNTSTGNGGTDGGAIQMTGGEVNLLGGEISGNEGAYGGAIRAGGGRLNLKGTVIENNTARKDGGAIYALRTEITMTGGRISGNYAATTAGGMNLGSGCQADLSGGSISGNYAVKHGGGLATSGKEPVVTLSGVSITGNSCGDYGGGILAYTGTVTITGGSISGNTAKYGGGIRGAKSTVNIYGGSISGNKATADGGAIYTINTVLNMKGITVRDNEAALSGGALALGTGTKATLTNVTVENNTSANYGGGILMQGTAPELTMTGCTVKDNTTGSFGGGIAAYRGTFTAKNITITGNTAGYGGGFYTGRATKATLTNYTVTGNEAINDGGGLYLLRSPIDLDTGVISGNTAGTYGGGIACGTETVVHITGVTTISENTAASGGGLLVQGTQPAVYVGDGTNRVRIVNNKVTGSGGAIRAGVNGNVYGILDITNAEISGNSSDSSEAGAIGSGVYYGRRMQSVYENVTIADNHGAGQGGGVYVGYNSRMILKNCAITGNSSIGNAGGLYLMSMSRVTLDNTPVTGNTTAVRGGGAVIQPGAQLTMVGSSLAGNTAGIGGGAYIERAGKLDAQNSTITGNTVSRQASAIYAEGSVYLTDTEITGNTDQAGGSAVYLDGAAGDSESYLPDVCQFKGKVIIADNEGGELVLVNRACVNIYGDGLASDSRILVDNPEGGITDLVVGPYDYIREGDRYTLTAGDKSLNEADPVTVTEEVPEETTGNTEPAPEPGKSPVLTVVLIGVIALAVLACVLIAILGIRRKKK